MLSWGSAAGQLGHHRDPDAEPEGPMALDIAADGAVAVLDQVHARVQVLRPGQPPQAFPIGRRTFQDLAWLPGGQGLVLLDRLGSPEGPAPALVAFGPDGALRWQLPLVGPGIAEGGGTTALFARADGIWVEVEHARVVRVAGLDGTADPLRPAREGRPAGDHLVRAAIADEDTVVLHGTAADGTPRFLTHVDFPLPILALRAVDADASGRVIVVANLVREGADGALADERLTAVVVAADGTELRRVDLPLVDVPGRMAEEQFRPLRVAPDGTLYRLACRATGVTVERFQP